MVLTHARSTVQVVCCAHGLIMTGSAGPRSSSHGSLRSPFLSFHTLNLHHTRPTPMFRFPGWRPPPRGEAFLTCNWIDHAASQARTLIGMNCFPPPGCPASGPTKTHQSGRWDDADFVHLTSGQRKRIVACTLKVQLRRL